MRQQNEEKHQLKEKVKNTEKEKGITFRIKSDFTSVFKLWGV